MKVFGVEFAPLRIPLERRLQTAAVFYQCVSWIIYLNCGMIASVYLLFFTKFYFLPLLYLAWFAYDHKQCCRGGRRSEWWRNMPVWNYFRDYFPIKMVKTAELDPSKNYIFGYHPHGIICNGALCCFTSEATNFSKLYPGITPRLLTLEGQFYVPFHREYVMASGACAASKESINWLLTEEGKGNALILVIGGAAEALDARPGKVTSLVLGKRKGFVKLALKHGASLVPVFAFGENDLFDQMENPEGSRLRTIQNTLKKYCGVSFPVFHGRGMFQYNVGMLPYRRPIHVIIGKPIDVEKVSEPTDEQISKIHNLYIEKLTELFEEHKLKYDPELKLIIS